ncbi:MAG: hypothetical protein ACXWQR_19380 [Ktedonobacterales bacterium]
MRFEISYTTDPSKFAKDPHPAEYPPSTVDEPYEDRRRVEKAPWKDKPNEVAAWKALGHEVDPDGIPVEVDRGVRHFVEVNTLDELLALVRKYGPLIINERDNYGYIPGYSGPTLEIYNDYRE